MNRLENLLVDLSEESLVHQSVVRIYNSLKDGILTRLLQDSLETRLVMLSIFQAEATMAMEDHRLVTDQLIIAMPKRMTKRMTKRRRKRRTKRRTKRTRKRTRKRIKRKRIRLRSNTLAFSVIKFLYSTSVSRSDH